MTYGNCEKHPNFPLINCPVCKSETMNQQNAESKLEQAAIINYLKRLHAILSSCESIDFANDHDLQEADILSVFISNIEANWQSLTTPASNEVEQDKKESISKLYDDFFGDSGWSKKHKGHISIFAELCVESMTEQPHKWVKAENNPPKNGYYICWCKDNEKGLIHYHKNTGWQNGFYDELVTHWMYLIPPEDAATPSNPHTVEEGQTQEPVGGMKCNGNCGMNYCDEYGCIENKPEGDVSHLLTPPPSPVGIEELLYADSRKPLKVIEQDDTTPMDKLLESTLVEENELWNEVIDFGENFNDDEKGRMEFISQLQSTYKISKR